VCPQPDFAAEALEPGEMCTVQSNYIVMLRDWKYTEYMLLNIENQSKIKQSLAWWYTAVFPETREAKIGGSPFEISPCKTLSDKSKKNSGVRLSCTTPFGILIDTKMMREASGGGFPQSWPKYLVHMQPIFWESLPNHVEWYMFSL
jgi:hypothetical protein